MDKAPLKGSTKRLLIDRANATMLIMIGGAAFIVVFCLIASKALLDQSGYQSRVTKAKELTLKQLMANNNSVETLVASYKTFASDPQNIIGGSAKGSNANDGDNPKIVLDALPSKYDYPGMVSGFEKMLKSPKTNTFTLTTLTGSDDEIAQQQAAAGGAVAIQIPFSLSVKASYDGTKDLLTTLEKSIRPIYVSKVSITANGDSLNESVEAITFYQPEKPLNITSTVVK